MRTLFAITAAIMGLLLAQGQVEAQRTGKTPPMEQPTKAPPQTKPKGPLDVNDPVVASKDAAIPNHLKDAFKQVVPAKDKVKVPVAYLSFLNSGAHRDVTGVHIRVSGGVHNYTLKTISGATYAIERWNGAGWTSLKSGTFQPIDANKRVAAYVDLPPSNDAMKFRFVVTPSVEGSKQFELPNLAGGKKAPTKGPIDVNAKVVAVEDKAVIPEAYKDAFKVPVRDRIEIPTQYLSIAQFNAQRHPGRILVAATIRNQNSRQAVSSAAYTMSRWNGTAWSTIQNGKLDVKANGAVYEFVNLPWTKDSMKVKFDMPQSIEGSVQFTMPAEPQSTPEPKKVLVVKYRCPDWQQEYFSHGSNELVGARARALQTVLTGLGFETKIEYRSSTFSTKYEQWVHYRLSDWREKTFETRTAAIQFHGSLPNGAIREILER